MDYILQPEGGLANRTHAILKFMLYARKKNLSIKVVWGDQNATSSHVADGHFLDVFSPLGECNFLDKAPAGIVDYQGWGGTNYTPTPNDFNNILKQHRDELLESYKLLRPSKITALKVAELQQRIQTFNAIHVRRTDFSRFLKKKGVRETLDDEFSQFILEEKPTPTYLATDNKETQTRFLKNHPSNCFTHQEIEAREHKNFRNTDLFHTGVDLFACTAAQKFKGSKHSTFSTLIKRIRQNDK